MAMASKQGRERQQHVHDAHDHVIQPPPQVAGQRPRVVPMTMANPTVAKPITSEKREP